MEPVAQPAISVKEVGRFSLWRKGEEVRGMLLRRKLSVLLAAALVSALMLAMTAAPAFAFIHEFIPAGECAASDQAGDNQTAAAAIVNNNPERDPPLGPPSQQGPPAPDTCPAP